jgi:hypothetical protein
VVGLLLTTGLATAEDATLSPTPVPQDNPAPERVTVRDGKLLMLLQGQWESVGKAIRLSEEVRVLTNQTFVVGEGKERKIEEGQTLGNDGYLTTGDGRVEPVFDHIAMKNGRVVLVRDGSASTVTETTDLANGSRVLPDGFFVAADGRRSRLLDGQLVRLSGASLPAVDTATLREGKVYVQKDGSSLLVALGRTMMMSDGSKVFGDATIVKRDGTRLTLAEGQIVKFEGVVVRPR